jgi:hypothetical protein
MCFRPSEAELVPCGVMEGTFGLKLGLELRVCKPLVSVRL